MALEEGQAFTPEDLEAAIRKLCHLFGLEPEEALDDLPEILPDRNMNWYSKHSNIFYAHTTHPYEIGWSIGHFLHFRANPSFYLKFDAIKKAKLVGEGFHDIMDRFNKSFPPYSNLLIFISHYAGLYNNDKGVFASDVSLRALMQKTEEDCPDAPEDRRVFLYMRTSSFPILQAAEYFLSRLPEAEFTRVARMGLKDAIRYIKEKTSIDIGEA